MGTATVALKLVLTEVHHSSVWTPTEGQLISKCLFVDFNFVQKTNEWIRFRSFFGRNWSQQKDISKLTDL